MDVRISRTTRVHFRFLLCFVLPMLSKSMSLAGHRSICPDSLLKLGNDVGCSEKFHLAAFSIDENTKCPRWKYCYEIRRLDKCIREANSDNSMNLNLRCPPTEVPILEYNGEYQCPRYLCSPISCLSSFCPFKYGRKYKIEKFFTEHRLYGKCPYVRCSETFDDLQSTSSVPRPSSVTEISTVIQTMPTQETSEAIVGQTTETSDAHIISTTSELESHVTEEGFKGEFGTPGRSENSGVVTPYEVSTTQSTVDKMSTLKSDDGLEVSDMPRFGESAGNSGEGIKNTLTTASAKPTEYSMTLPAALTTLEPVEEIIATATPLMMPESGTSGEKTMETTETLSTTSATPVDRSDFQTWPVTSSEALSSTPITGHTWKAEGTTERVPIGPLE